MLDTKSKFSNRFLELVTDTSLSRNVIFTAGLQRIGQWSTPKGKSVSQLMPLELSEYNH